MLYCGGNLLLVGCIDELVMRIVENDKIVFLGYFYLLLLLVNMLFWFG